MAAPQEGIWDCCPVPIGAGVAECGRIFQTRYWSAESALAHPVATGVDIGDARAGADADAGAEAVGDNAGVALVHPGVIIGHVSVVVGTFGRHDKRRILSDANREAGHGKAGGGSVESHGCNVVRAKMP